MAISRLVLILIGLAAVAAACEQRGSEPTSPRKTSAIAPPAETVEGEGKAGTGMEAPAGEAALVAAAPQVIPAPSVPPPVVAVADPWKGAVVEQYETAGGVIVEDLKVGEGDPVRLNDAVRVHYRGTLADGREFDSSWKRNETSTFYLTQYIPGWREGMVGMKVGGLRRMIIPAELGYGRTGSASVPPNSMLIFEVELLEIVR